MPQQTIPITRSFGADSRRVLDALTPVNGTAAPAVNAIFLGQIFINTTPTPPDVYVAVKVGDETPANDWKQLAFAQ